MKAWLPTILVPLCPIFAAYADAPPPARNTLQDPFALPVPQPAPLPTARPSDEAIRAAVRATLEEMPETPMPATGQALSGGAYREFARQFSQAEKPHCMGPNALKHQPAGFSTKTWNFGFAGIMALPLWGAAILRGKCNWTR